MLVRESPPGMPPREELIVKVPVCDGSCDVLSSCLREHHHISLSPPLSRSPFFPPFCLFCASNSFNLLHHTTHVCPPPLPLRLSGHQAMRCIHSEVSDALCNPFYVSGSPITSPGFYSRVGNILTAMTPPPPAVM